MLVASASGCNHISNNNEGETTTVTQAQTEVGTSAETQIATEGSIALNGNKSTAINYTITQSGEITLHLEDWQEEHVVTSVSLSDEEISSFRRAFKVVAVGSQNACLFLAEQNKVTAISFEKGSPEEKVTSLDISQDIIGIAGNFTDDNKGYLFAFEEVSDGHAAGGAKISNLYVTEDGGVTWNAISTQYVSSISLREHIIFARMVSQDVGMISGNYFATDYNFCERTLLTIDGGHNWANVADLPQINELAWAIVDDFSLVDGDYILTVRYTASELENTYAYAKYQLVDMTTWVRIS